MALPENPTEAQKIATLRFILQLQYCDGVDEITFPAH